MNSIGISLGWDCGPAGQGVKLGLRPTKEQGYKTCPFDLMITNYLGVIDCIEDDFKYFCDPQYLHVLNIEKDYTYLAFKKGDRVIVNTKYNFIFNHESPGHGNLYIQENWENGQEHFIIDNFKALIERYTRRIQNFRNYIYDPNLYIRFIITKLNCNYYVSPGEHSNRGLEIVIVKTYPSMDLKSEFITIDETRQEIFQEAEEMMLSTIPAFYQQINLQPLEDNYKVAFVIAHKYIKNYPTYIDYYVSNIQTYYKNSSIFIVDNQSENLEDIKTRIKNQSNVHFLINDSESKYELGAYNYGINHIITTNQTTDYDYYVFTQDSFILKNKYDFNILTNNRVKACPIMEIDSENVRNSFHTPSIMKVLFDIGETDVDNLYFCFANSFVLHHSKIEEFHSMTKNITTTTKKDSQNSERFLAGVLYKLNNRNHFNIDGFVRIDGKDVIPYNFWTVNVKYYKTHKHFIKRVNNKTENTKNM